MSNILELKQKPKMIGVTLSFTLEFGPTTSDKMNAQIYIEQFNEAVRELAKTGFPRLTNTVISRNEYSPT